MSINTLDLLIEALATDKAMTELRIREKFLNEINFALEMQFSGIEKMYVLSKDAQARAISSGSLRQQIVVGSFISSLDDIYSFAVRAQASLKVKLSIFKILEARVAERIARLGFVSCDQVFQKHLDTLNGFIQQELLLDSVCRDKYREAASLALKIAQNSPQPPHEEKK